MSFDTVIFKKAFEPFPTAYWLDVGFTPVTNGNLARNDDRISITVHQNGYGKKDWLWAQASLPKLVFGHNATLPCELEAREAASLLCDHVSSHTKLDFTLDNTQVFRIDYARDYYIREDLSHAIALELSAADLPYFPSVCRKGDTVSFQREQAGKVTKQLEIYPKFLWAINTHQPIDVIAASRGKLRLEVRLWRKGLRGIKGAVKPLDYLSQSNSDSLLDEAAAMLDLPRIIGSRNIDFHEMLIVHSRGHGSLGTSGLGTFIELVLREGEKFYTKSDFHYSKSSYYKRRGELKDMGMWDDLVAASQLQTP